MKILHCCLSNFYAEGFGYQENLLPKANRMAGHDVSILASCETYVAGETGMVLVEPCSYTNEDGCFVTRVPYRKGLPLFLARKVRAYEGVWEQIEKMRPDVIFFHGMSGYEMMTVARYGRKHPETRLCCDNHAAFVNSARTFFSKNVLHKGMYRYWVARSLDAFDAVYAIAPECADFLVDIYGVPRDRVEMAYLGDFVEPEDAYRAKRGCARRRLGVGDEEVVLAHSGKLTSEKRTKDILDAMRRVTDPRLRLVIAGNADPDVKKVIDTAIARDSRISFAGWRGREDMVELLSGADVYVQPGTPSSTAQTALCCRCALTVRHAPIYFDLLGEDGWYIEGPESIAALLTAILNEGGKLDAERARAFSISKERLDYRRFSLAMTGGL